MSSFCPWKKNLDPKKKCMTESKENHGQQISCALYLRSPPFITDLEAGFGCSTPIASPCSLHAGSNGPSAYHEQTSAFIGIKLCQTLSELHNPQTAGGFTKSGEFPSKDASRKGYVSVFFKGYIVLLPRPEILFHTQWPGKPNLIHWVLLSFLFPPNFHSKQ